MVVPYLFLMQFMFYHILYQYYAIMILLWRSSAVTKKYNTFLLSYFLKLNTYFIVFLVVASPVIVIIFCLSINYSMKTSPITPLKHNDPSSDNDRRKLKTSPPATYTTSNEKKSEEPILSFQCNQYTFLNESHPQVTALKTIINITLNTEKLQKIVQLNHPNIIAIRKIIKSSPRETSLHINTQTHYSFYYQPVNYSLKYLSQHPEEKPRLFNLLITLDLKAALNSLVQYLEEGNIFYVPKIEDLGISNQGILKIYISPIVVFYSKYDVASKRSVGVIGAWWQAYRSSMGGNMFKKEKKLFQLQPPKLSTISDLSLEQGSFMENNLEKELGELLQDGQRMQPSAGMGLKESTSSFSRVGSVQLQKIKKIDQEIRVIREKLNQKQGNLKQSYNSSEMKEMQKQRQIGVGVVKQFQGKEVKIESGNGNSNYYREPIQQNINCINIYNHNNHISPKQIAAIPSYIPKHQQMMQKHYYDTNIDPDFFRDHDEEYSQDTYDIEFDAQFQVPHEITKNNYRNTLISPNERELSQYSQHIHKKKGQIKPNQFKSKIHTNQVCNKNYTQSAGPLQFKSFVNKYMKQGKDQVENVKESQQTFQQSQQQKTNSSYTQSNVRAVSMQKGMKKQFGRNKVESLCQHNADIKRIYSQNQFSIYSRPLTTGQSEIEQKVKRALQKTKNAIALLNRVKSSKAMSRPQPFQ